MNTTPFFVFDVKSVGLHGEAFAVAGGIYINGAAQSEFRFCCPLEEAKGDDDDREWVKANVPVMEITHCHPAAVREAFWSEWENAKKRYPEIASVMLSAGMDPMAKYERQASELPAHEPLANARQSARLLAEALNAIALRTDHSLPNPLDSKVDGGTIA